MIPSPVQNARVYAGDSVKVPTKEDAAIDTRSEIQKQLDALTNANEYLHSAIIDLESALTNVLRPRYDSEEIATVAKAEPQLVPVANNIRNNVENINYIERRIRDIIYRSAV